MLNTSKSGENASVLCAEVNSPGVNDDAGELLLLICKSSDTAAEDERKILPQFEN